MQSAELRERFLSFFEAREHVRVPSDSLIPSDDPTVLFTSAGMNQFKDHFVGTRTDLTRAASCQKCLRTGDLDHVGKTPMHHSFFEMLGNFSFGDYFKTDAIQWAWEFLTQDLALPKNRLWVTVYEDDDEAEAVWKTRIKIPARRIGRLGEAENFWPANARTQGPNGPCGPCSEVHFDRTGTCAKGRSDCSPACDCGRFLEVWNLVFTQFNRKGDGTLDPLPRTCIDTGMGLERLASVLQGTPGNYETDLFAPIIAAIGRWPRGKGTTGDAVLMAERAIADHARAIVFLIAAGVLPSNEARGYVLRMLIRRAHRLGRVMLRLDLERSPSFLSSLVEPVEEAMRNSPYAHELAAKRQTIRRTIEHEETQFIQTLEVGMTRLEAMMDRLIKARKQIIPGEEAFKLYDTYGFPVELTADIAKEKGLTVDRAGFETAFKAQQQRSRSGSQFSPGVFMTDTLRVRGTVQGLPAREEQFVGYETLRGEGRIQGLWNGSGWVDRISAHQEAGVVLDRSPFYGESGGQIGDTGRIEGSRGGVAEVRQTTWVDDVLLHHATVAHGTLSVQEPVRALVDADRRRKVARSHTATHLLHWALRKILGPETVQAGSLVDADRIRFDFSSPQGLHEEQRMQVEALVNSRVQLADDVRTSQMPLKEAKRTGALAFFGEKYGSAVRVVTIGDYSKELCGGTHLEHTGFVGTFTIVGESSIAAGTRRIDALVGEAAVNRQQEESRLLHEVGRRLGRPVQELVAGLEELLEQLKRSERERKMLRLEMAKVEARRLIAEGKQINGVMFIAATLKNTDRESLAALADAVKTSLEHEGIVLLASGDAGRVAVVMATTQNVAKRVHAGQMLKAITPIMQGSGGGRPEFAQGGGKDPSRLPAALKRAEELVREALER